jgi:hypothetical protein
MARSDSEVAHLSMSGAPVELWVKFIAAGR